MHFRFQTEQKRRCGSRRMRQMAYVLEPCVDVVIRFECHDNLTANPYQWSEKNKWRMHTLKVRMK